METEIEDALHHMLIILSISRLYLLPPWNHFRFVYFFGCLHANYVTQL